MYILHLTDRNGQELKEGDIVKVISGGYQSTTFFAEVKFLEKEKVLTPFHTFSFHAFEKVDKLPEGAILLDEPRYKIWHKPGLTKDQSAAYQKYLIDWRACENLLDRCFHITKS